MTTAPKKKPQRISNQERSERSDKRMLAAAIELILEKGTEHTTLKEVGERAGYSRGLAGYRFGSKSGLFKFVLQTLGEFWLHIVTKETQGKVGLDAILTVTKKHYDLFSTNPENIKTFYILWFQVAGVDEEFKGVISSINEKRIDDIKSWILSDPSLEHKHKDALLIANCFNSATNGLIYNWLLNPDDLDTLKQAHQDLEQLITSLLV